ncbi:MAG: hypothetical protein AAFU77_11105 [Myxococcota bacterium]
MTGRYRILDEPSAKPWGEKLIVNPIGILFISMVLPVFWEPPALGRFWMPLAWLMLNGIALGSSTLKKEFLAMGIGTVAWFGALVAGGFYLDAERFGDYLRITLFGIFLMTLYVVVLHQNRSYELFTYLNRDR